MNKSFSKPDFKDAKQEEKAHEVEASAQEKQAKAVKDFATLIAELKADAEKAGQEAAEKARANPEAPIEDDDKFDASGQPLEPHEEHRDSPAFTGRFDCPTCKRDWAKAKAVVEARKARVLARLAEAEKLKTVSL